MNDQEFPQFPNNNDRKLNRLYTNQELNEINKEKSLDNQIDQYKKIAKLCSLKELQDLQMDDFIYSFIKKLIIRGEANELTPALKDFFKQHIKDEDFELAAKLQDKGSQ